jgi:predicted acylesterase/phospholipase RssA
VSPAPVDGAEYRVLALSGGGVRGILQTRFLERLEREVGPLDERFDMFAATSTGALVALGLASGVSARALIELYETHARSIFRRRLGTPIRKGPRYDARRLRKVLEEQFGDRRLGDLPVEVVICASALDRYQGRVFTTHDADMSLVDAALASAAAPTYFGPVVPDDSQRGYVDGGLWANDPLLVAVAHAVGRLEIPAKAIEALSIGTGRVARGCTPAEVAEMRTLSLETVRFLIEITGSLQEWGAERLLSWLSPTTRVRRVNPDLAHWVPLDDARAALDQLPAIAETEYEDQAGELVAWLTSPRRPAPVVAPSLHPALDAGIREAGLSRFIPARRFYGQYRGGHDSISSYVALATRTLTMVSINLATGHHLEQVERSMTQMLDRDVPVRIRVSLLNYHQSALMEAISSILDVPSEEISESIKRTTDKLLAWRRELDQDAQPLVELFQHRTIPSASAILLDANRADGRIQLETKPYKAPLTASWAIEINAGCDFFETQREAYHQIVADADELELNGDVMSKMRTTDQGGQTS